VVKASTPPPPPAPPPPPPVPPVKLSIAGVTSTSAGAMAGKRFAVGFRIKPSGAKLSVVTRVGGVVVGHATSLVAGKGRVTLVVPKKAKGKLLTIKVTIRLGGQAATRTVSFRIH
jgi:hypothetical protein